MYCPMTVTFIEAVYRQSRLAAELPRKTAVAKVTEQDMLCADIQRTSGKSTI